MGLEMHGIDLSAAAIAAANRWLSQQVGEDVARRAVVGDIRSLPWGDGFFDHAISDGVLDSMPFQIAQSGISELARVLKPGGLFYCSLISGDESGRDSEFCGEEYVRVVHEKDTIQSYFNQSKIPPYSSRDSGLWNVSWSRRATLFRVRITDAGISYRSGRSTRVAESPIPYRQPDNPRIVPRGLPNRTALRTSRNVRRGFPHFPHPTTARSRPPNRPH